MRNIKYLVVHCTAGSQKQVISDLKKHWKSLGWKNNGYHYVVDPSGKIHHITPEENIANGVGGYNKQSIHISYIGGIDNKGEAVDNRTDDQKMGLVSILEDLKRKYPKAKILGHRDFSPDTDRDGIVEFHEYIKQCPCFNAIEEYKNI
jgi:N-acetylmuramoyl-L-alanine amidase